jgi:magnesium chelatase subunit D
MSTEHLIGISEKLTNELACAALTPGLRQILLFDISPGAFRNAGDHMAAFLKAATGRMPSVVTLGSAEQEDDLWMTLTLEKIGSENCLSLKQGRLVPSPGSTDPILVLIPDLARLSLHAARACVMLMGGAETVSLQRNGLNFVWSPDMCWLAGCAKAEIGEVSKHLLDRFVLRLTTSETLSSNRRSDDVLNWAMAAETIPAPPPSLRLSDSLEQRLSTAFKQLPTVSPAAMRYALSCCGGSEAQGIRRELALVRLSRALAQWAGAAETTLEHARHAADLIGLKPAGPQSPSLSPAPITEQPSVPEEKLPPNIPATNEALEKGASTPIIKEEPVTDKVLLSDTEMTFDASPISPTPYPEDTTPIAHEAESLHLPSSQSWARAADGPIIGTQRATSLKDLALTNTIVEAAKFQKVRPPREDGSSAFRMSRSDLHSYRRAPVPEQMLMLILDYTCLNDCHWEEALWPHLRWAYITRSSVTVVQVGQAQSKGNSLRAQMVSARNLLSPRIREALAAAPGNSTPLAHGLDIAARTLRAALQHGRGRIQQVRLVVLTDGRGNIPLKASYADSLLLPVSREGVEDSLLAARDLRALSKVDSYFLNPQPQHYAELPGMLADALGAEIENIPLREEL